MIFQIFFGSRIINSSKYRLFALTFKNSVNQKIFWTITNKQFCGKFMVKQLFLIIVEKIFCLFYSYLINIPAKKNRNNLFFGSIHWWLDEKQMTSLIFNLEFCFFFQYVFIDNRNSSETYYCIWENITDKNRDKKQKILFFCFRRTSKR